MMNNIGYRVKLNEYLGTDDTYKNFLNEYFQLFSIMEVKLNNYLINHNNADNYIKYLLDVYQSRVSFHFNKNILDVGLNSVEKEIINYLLAKQYSINCITHLNPHQNNSDVIRLINEEFNNNAVLTLENPEIKGDIFPYLESIAELFHKLDESNSTVGLCIDWGHILLHNTNVNSIFNKMKKEDLLRYIVEYHIHNIKNNHDHQTICDGEVDCGEIYDLIKSSNSRIILECEVNNMQDDGLKNIKLLTKK